jgi:hypothetical protein
MYRKILQTSVAAAALIAFTAAYSAPASAADDSFKSGNKNSLKMSGQVNRAVMWVDNGDESEFFHVDNDNSSTRIRWVGKAAVNENFSVGFVWEVQAESNSSSNVTFAGNDGDAGNNLFNERKTDVWLSHKDIGKLSLGQGDASSNGIAEINMLGQGAMYAGISDTAGSILFRSSTTTGPAIGKAWDRHDGLSRLDRIRYDTPKFAGFVASATHSQGGDWDIALRHAGKFGQFKTKAGISYIDLGQTSNTQEDMVAGSIAIMHDSGLNLTFSAGSRDNKGATRKDDDHFYVAVGYVAKLTDVGTTAFAVDYGNADDVAANGDDFETFGVAVTQNLKDVSSQLYITYRNHSLDRPGVGNDFDDIDVVMFGTKVKF